MKTHKLLLFIILFFNLLLFGGATAYAQKHGQALIDSLESVLKTAKEDTNKVNTLIKLAQEQDVHSDTSLILENQALQLAEKNEVVIRTGKCHLAIALFYDSRRKYDLVLDHYSKTIEICDEIEKSGAGSKAQVLTLRAKAFGVIGMSNYKQGNYPKALDYCFKALKIAEEVGDKMEIERYFGFLGVVYYGQGDFTNSMDYYSKALKIAEEIGDKKGMTRHLGNIGNIYVNQSNYAKALDCYLKASKIAEELGDVQSQAINIGNILAVYSRQGDYSKALEYGFKALKITDSLSDKEGSAQNLGNIGLQYLAQSDYPKALDYFLKALKINEAFANKKGIAIDIGNIGNIYQNQGDYSKALDYYLKALKMTEELGDKYNTARHLSNIGNTYNKQGDYSKAMDYYLKALKMTEDLGIKVLQAGNLNNIGNIYLDQKDYPKALEYLFKSLKIADGINEKDMIAMNLGNIGSAYTRQNKFKEANKFLHDALNLATGIGALDLIEGENKHLAELYSRQGDWKNAYTYYAQEITIRDSINNEEKAKKQTRLEMNYEFEKTQAVDSAKHEKEMAVANVENKRQKLFKNVSLGGFSVMLLFAGVFFTQRNRISKGKKLSDELLLNILPAETAEELKLTGSAKAKSYDTVTILFTDFRNFTQASEQMSAEELVNEIHYCYSEFDRIIAKHNIEKIKTIGDSYMCAGGLPVENKTNPVEVVRAALEIQQFIAKEKEERQKNNKPFFEIRIGINTGPVVAGIVGIKKFAYDIWGDTVNIASRMESSGEVGKVNISGSTYELVKDKFACTHRGKIDAKNKGMIDMYFVGMERNPK